MKRANPLVGSCDLPGAGGEVVLEIRTIVEGEKTIVEGGDPGMKRTKRNRYSAGSSPR